MLQTPVGSAPQRFRFQGTSSKVNFALDDIPNFPPLGQKLVIGVSGGLDSTQALIVCARAMDELKLPRHVARFVLTAGSAMNQNGTALFEDSDYYEGSGRLVFQVGETSQELQMFVVGDTHAEGDERFHVDLSNPVNAATCRTEQMRTVSSPPIQSENQPQS